MTEPTSAPLPDDSPRRRVAPRVMAGLVMAAMLAAGFAGGVAFDHGFLHHRGARGDVGPGDRGPGGPGGIGFVPGAGAPGRAAGARPVRRPPSLDRFAHDLGLSAPQVAAVDSLMADDFSRVTAIREAMQPRVDSVILGTRARIEAVLTPEQRTRYRALLAEQERRMAEWRARRPDGAPPR